MLEHTVMPYQLALPFMNALATYARVKHGVSSLFGVRPTYNCLLGDGLSVNGRKVRDGAGGWKALDAIYNFEHPSGSSVFLRTMDAWWMNIRNAQAVRNRLKIGIDELLRAVELRSKETDGPVRILSLAAGAAPLVIQTVVRARAIGIEVQVLLVDLDCSALAYARSEAQRNGVENSS